MNAHINEKWILKIPRLVEIYISILKLNVKFKEEKKQIENTIFCIKDYTDTVAGESLEMFKAVVNHPVQYFNAVNALVEEMKKDYNDAVYKIVSKVGSNNINILFSLLNSKSADIVFMDNFTTEEAGGIRTKDGGTERIINRCPMYFLATSQLSDYGYEVERALESELKLINNTYSQEEPESLRRLYNAADNYELNDLIRTHNTESVISILQESYDANINSFNRDNIMNFIYSVIGNVDAYNTLIKDTGIIYSQYDMCYDLILRMAYVITKNKHSLESSLRMTVLDNKRAKELILNVQKESAGIRFIKAEVLLESDFEDYTITEPSYFVNKSHVIKKPDTTLYIKANTRINPETNNRIQYYSEVALLISGENQTLDFYRDKDKISKLLTIDDLIVFIGKLALEVYMEVYRMAADYKEKYSSVIKETFRDTASTFYTVGELLKINDLDKEKISEIFIDNYKMHSAIEYLGNKSCCLVGSTSNTEQEKDIVRIAIMLAVYIGDLKYGNGK